MVVISISSCPATLRGDITKWLIEIDTGVYVGRLSARVRDELWSRIRDNVKAGRVIMVYNAQNSQGYEIRTHNTIWKPIDFDGITLMKHPLPIVKKEGTSKKSERLSKTGNKPSRKKTTDLWKNTSDYTVIDLETTGLDVRNDDIIEIAALQIRNNKITKCFSKLIMIERQLSEDIIRLTGITPQMLNSGETADKVMSDYLDFIGESVLVSHNAEFDLGFINALCERMGRVPIHNKVFDTLKLSRRNIRGIENYRLATIASYFEIDITGAHRAATDARITMEIFEKLKKIGSLR